MSFKLSPEEKNVLYYKIRLNIRDKELNEASYSILFLLEDFIENNLGHQSSEDNESGEIKLSAIKPGGTFRRVDS